MSANVPFSTETGLENPPIKLRSMIFPFNRPFSSWIMGIPSHFIAKSSLVVDHYFIYQTTICFCGTKRSDFRGLDGLDCAKSPGEEGVSSSRLQAAPRLDVSGSWASRSIGPFEMLLSHCKLNFSGRQNTHPMLSTNLLSNYGCFSGGSGWKGLEGGTVYPVQHGGYDQHAT